MNVEWTTEIKDFRTKNRDFHTKEKHQFAISMKNYQNMFSVLLCKIWMKAKFHVRLWKGSHSS